MNARDDQASDRAYIWLPVLMGLGTGLGALYGNVGVGMAIGAGVGTLLSVLAWLWGRR